MKNFAVSLYADVYTPFGNDVQPAAAEIKNVVICRDYVTNPRPQPAHSMKSSVSPVDALQSWKLFLAGDAHAFESLMSRHFQALFHYGSKFSRDREFVKDCIQDLFLNLWEKRENLGSDVVVRAYLMASLRRQMHRAAQSRLPADESEDLEDGLFDMCLSVEQDFIENESNLALTEKLKSLVDQLPARQKEVIYLRFFQDLDRTQISLIMGVSPQTVSNLLQIALKQLKKYWHFTLLVMSFFAGCEALLNYLSF